MSDNQPSSSTNSTFFLDRVGEEQPKTDGNAESSKKDGEGTNEGTSFGAGKLPERIVKLNQASVSRPAIEGLDLDEYIQKQNIVAPTKSRKRMPFQYERPLTSKKLNKKGRIDPGLSSDEESIFDTTQPNESTSGLQQQNAERQTPEVQDKPETVSKIVPENGAGVCSPYHVLKYEDAQEWTNNPWKFLTVLKSKGIPLFWEVLRRLDFQIVATANDQSSRRFRCVVSFNHIIGVCEASNSIQAKHGAAWNFLQEFKKAMPSSTLVRLGAFPDTSDDANLIRDSAFYSLLERMKRVFGDAVFHNVTSFEEKINGRTLFKCLLQMAWAKFEGTSYINASTAQLFAVKAAFEKLVGEPFPMEPVHLGIANCTTLGGSIYRIVESQRVHYPDFSIINMD